MLRRYELTDEEWLRIEPLLPPENTGKQGRPRKDNRIIMNGIVWLARSGAPWRDLPEDNLIGWPRFYASFDNDREYEIAAIDADEGDESDNDPQIMIIF